MKAGQWIKRQNVFRKGKPKKIKFAVQENKVKLSCKYQNNRLWNSPLTINMSNKLSPNAVNFLELPSHACHF